MKDIVLRNAEQLGMAIRSMRQQKNVSQQQLAAELGVERKWVMRLEAGNPKAELGLVLAAVAALGMRASLTRDTAGPGRRRPAGRSRLDEVFERLQRPARK